MVNLRMPLIVFLLLAGSVVAQDEVIDFETLPDGSPVTEGTLLTDQYADWGVTFEMLDGVDGPRIAKVGNPRTAFQGPNRSLPDCGIDSNTSSDTPADGVDVGCLFLTDDNIHNFSAFALRVNYLTPVFRAYGELLDIDFTESWQILAFDVNGNVIEEINIVDGDPGTGNGLATGWLFDTSVAIHAIELHPDTVNAHNFGLAFDNFSPSSIPHFPVCDAGGPYFANAGTPITFDGSGSSDSDGDVVSWHWDFGDGESADGVSPTHTYADDGNYTVVLTVTDNDGNETSCSPDDVVATETQNWDALKALYK